MMKQAGPCTLCGGLRRVTVKSEDGKTEKTVPCPRCSPAAAEKAGAPYLTK